MSVQFGRWHFGGQPAVPGYLEKASQMLAPYGPDGEGTYSAPGLDIIYRAFHTTRESRLEKQPVELLSAAVITWDGRLDNREELISELGQPATIESTDLAIVGAAYELWGTKSFAKLLGDWALSVWNPRNRELILAKDFLGTRHLYYSQDKEQVTWSTILDPLVLLAGKTFQLEEEYIAGWLAFFPATHLTPYVGIHSVPPSCFVRASSENRTVTKYWDFDPHKRIRYATDAEYEEHFRTVFRESVRKRLRSDSPILAELSGGMDSSSIVCMADQIIAQGQAETPRLDTVSYYDDSEPNWNERPYFTKVEEQRGRIGCHINASSFASSILAPQRCGFIATPVSFCTGINAAKEFAVNLASQGNRVVLSGVGGDEFTGGVPTPIPELASLLASGKFISFVCQLKVWALNKRQPWLHLFWETTRSFLPMPLVRRQKCRKPAPWLNRNFIKCHRAALAGYPFRLKLFGPRPNFQDALSTLDALRRQLALELLPSDPAYLKCYPYLDRNLLNFLYAIPRDQLVRPAQRRSLLRRAFIGIVPGEVINRRRKAFVVRSPLAAIRSECVRSGGRQQLSVSSAFSITDHMAFIQTLENALRGEVISTVAVTRVCALESWLQLLQSMGPSSPLDCRLTRGFAISSAANQMSRTKPGLSAETVR